MESIVLESISSVVYGQSSDKLFVFVHGKGGSKEDAGPFASIACPNGYQVLSFDLPSLEPWHAVPTLDRILTKAKESWAHVSIRANSIGAYFTMLSNARESIDRCLFVSPILDMERLIGHMMAWRDVTEDRLQKEKIIQTDFGEPLSWEYLSYVREHRIESWSVPTAILYGTADNLTGRKTVDAFVARFGAGLTVMEGGEHWFHTSEQLDVLDRWERACLL
jgi:pimeloyl-ACP methyl ester carboxylesterase